MTPLFRSRLAALGAGLALLLPSMPPASAHEGHDHGDETPAAALPSLAPRTESATELFELLLVHDGAQLVLWVDRFSSNEPVADARIEVEGQGWKAVAARAPDGSYRVAPPAALGAGSHALVFTVQAGNDADLLEATLVVPPATPAAMAAARPAPAAAGGEAWRGVGLAALALGTVALGAMALRRRRAQPTQEAA